MVGGRRFHVEDVGPVAADFAAVEGGDDVGGLDDFAAGAVEDDHAVLHFFDLRGADQTAGFIGQETMERDDVGLGQNLVHRGAAGHLVGRTEGFVEMRIAGDHLHAEGAGADGDFLANPAEADDAEGFPPNFVTGEAQPFALAGGGGGGDDVLGDADEQAEGVLGDGGVIDAGGEQNRDFVFLGGGDVDLVEADAVFGDDFEARQGFLDDGASDGVIAAKKGVEVTGEFEHAGLGERAAFADDFPALGFHEGMVGAGSVLVTASGEKDTHGERRGNWVGRSKCPVQVMAGFGNGAAFSAGGCAWGVQDKKVILDTTDPSWALKEGRSASAHADGEPIGDHQGFSSAFHPHGERVSPLLDFFVLHPRAVGEKSRLSPEKMRARIVADPRP